MSPISLLTLFLLQPPGVVQSATPAPSPGQPVLKMPAQIQAQPGQIFVVKADTNLKWKRWTIPGGLVRVPPEDTKYGEDAYVGYGPAGVYEFRLEGTTNDQYAEGKTVVFVGQPAPGPTPNPIPPPAPPIPVPGDPLVMLLQEAFQADGKRTDIRDRLVRLWADAAASVIDNEDFRTMADFRKAMHDAAAAHPYRLKPSDLLKGCRERIGAELAALCNSNEQCPLGKANSELRTKVKALLERYAAALVQVK